MKQKKVVGSGMDKAYVAPSKKCPITGSTLTIHNVNYNIVRALVLCKSY